MCLSTCCAEYLLFITFITLSNVYDSLPGDSSECIGSNFPGFPLLLSRAELERVFLVVEFVRDLFNLPLREFDNGPDSLEREVSFRVEFLNRGGRLIDSFFDALPVVVIIKQAFRSLWFSRENSCKVGKVRCKD